MNNEEPTIPPIPSKVIVEHIVDQQTHVESLRQADLALKEALDAIEEGRRRLLNAIRRYEERMHGPNGNS